MIDDNAGCFGIAIVVAMILFCCYALFNVVDMQPSLDGVSRIVVGEVQQATPADHANILDTVSGFFAGMWQAVIVVAVLLTAVLIVALVINYLIQSPERERQRIDNDFERQKNEQAILDGDLDLKSKAVNVDYHCKIKGLHYKYQRERYSDWLMQKGGHDV